MSSTGVPSRMSRSFTWSVSPSTASSSSDRQADRIRAMRRARGENAAPLGAARRQHFRAPAFVQMKPEDDPDVVPRFEIGQRVLEVLVGKELDGAAHSFCGIGLPRGVHPLFERRMHDTDRVHVRSGTGVGLFQRARWPKETRSLRVQSSPNLVISAELWPKWRNGRRDGFKIRYSQECEGSSPSFGTQNRESNSRHHGPRRSRRHAVRPHPQLSRRALCAARGVSRFAAFSLEHLAKIDSANLGAHSSARSHRRAFGRSRAAPHAFARSALTVASPTSIRTSSRSAHASLT